MSPGRRQVTGKSQGLRLAIHRIAARPSPEGKGRWPHPARRLAKRLRIVGDQAQQPSRPICLATASAIDTLSTSNPKSRVLCGIGPATSVDAWHSRLTQAAQPTTLRLRPVPPSCLGRRSLAKNVIAPAFDRAVGPYPAGAAPTGTDGVKLRGRQRGSALNVIASAFDRSVNPHPAGVPEPGADFAPPTPRRRLLTAREHQLGDALSNDD